MISLNFKRTWLLLSNTPLSWFMLISIAMQEMTLLKILKCNQGEISESTFLNACLYYCYCWICMDIFVNIIALYLIETFCMNVDPILTLIIFLSKI